MRTAEIAINIDGAEAEKITKLPFLNALHGCFSLGTVCGALVGLGLTSLVLPVEWHLGIVAGSADSFVATSKPARPALHDGSEP